MNASLVDPATLPVAAVTGASGFIGRHLVRALAQSGWRVRVLLRRDPAIEEWKGLQLEIVPGALGDVTALRRLVDGAQAVIHVAGLIKAARRREFFEVNCDGAAQLGTLTREYAPRAHFLLVSSLAAREPQLSDYAASKQAGERVVRDLLGERATILRPPAVYGPGDRETLLFFQLARQRWVPLLGSADSRAALIHVQDLVRLMVHLVASAPQGRTWTAADAQPQGYTWRQLLGAAAKAVGNVSPKYVPAPLTLLRMTALFGDLGKMLGASNMLNSQKLRELRHADWSVSSSELATVGGWSPAFDIDSGFADAVRWYRAEGWLLH